MAAVSSAGRDPVTPVRLLILAGAILCLSLPAHAADYWVRGEAVIQGAGVPGTCPAANTRFSAVVHVTTSAACQAHNTCTAAKVQAVNNWVAQLNQRNLGICVQFVQQAHAPCQYNC
jgi:hypothetical protein